MELEQYIQYYLISLVPDIDKTKYAINIIGKYEDDYNDTIIPLDHDEMYYIIYHEPIIKIKKGNTIITYVSPIKTCFRLIDILNIIEKHENNKQPPDNDTIFLNNMSYNQTLDYFEVSWYK